MSGSFHERALWWQMVEEAYLQDEPYRMAELKEMRRNKSGYTVSIRTKISSHLYVRRLGMWFNGITLILLCFDSCIIESPEHYWEWQISSKLGQSMTQLGIAPKTNKQRNKQTGPRELSQRAADTKSGKNTGFGVLWAYLALHWRLHRVYLETNMEPQSGSM